MFNHWYHFKQYVENWNLHDYPVSIYLDNEQDNQPDNTFISCQNTAKMATFMYLTEQKRKSSVVITIYDFDCN